MALNRKIILAESTLAKVLKRLNKIPPADTRFDAVPIGYMIRTSDEVFNEVAANPLLLERLTFAAIRVMDDQVRLLQRTISAQTKPSNALNAAVKSGFERGQAELDRAVKAVLDLHAQQNAAWSKYWKSTAKDLAVAAASLAFGAVNLGLAVPTGGGSLAFAIVGLYRGVVGGVRKLRDCWLMAEQIEQRLQRQVGQLTSAYRSSVHAGRAAEVGGAVFNALSIVPVNAAPTMSTITADLALWTGKLASLYQIANVLAVDLQKLLLECDQLRGALSPSKQAKLERFQKEISGLLDDDVGTKVARFRGRITISGAYLRFESGWERAAQLKADIAALQALDSKSGAKATAIMRSLAGFLVNASMVMHNYDGAVLHNASIDAFEWGGTVAKETGIVSGIAGDALGTVMDLREIVDAGTGESPEEDAEYERVMGGFAIDRMPAVPPPRPRRQNLAAAAPLNRTPTAVPPRGARLPLPPRPTATASAPPPPPPSRPVAASQP